MPPPASQQTPLSQTVHAADAETTFQDTSITSDLKKVETSLLPQQSFAASNPARSTVLPKASSLSGQAAQPSARSDLGTHVSSITLGCSLLGGRGLSHTEVSLGCQRWAAEPSSPHPQHGESFLRLLETLRQLRSESNVLLYLLYL